MTDSHFKSTVKILAELGWATSTDGFLLALNKPLKPRKASQEYQKYSLWHSLHFAASVFYFLQKRKKPGTVLKNPSN